MSLNDLNKEIYNPESKIISEHNLEDSRFNPKLSSDVPSPFKGEESWNKQQKRNNKIKIVYIFIVIFSLAAFIFGGIFVYKWWQKDAFHQDRVSISFEGPNEADSTQVTKYIIHYKNDNRATLKNAEIRLEYTENFKPTDSNTNLKIITTTSSVIDIPDVPPRSEKSVEIQGIFYAPKDTPLYLYASINFVPSNGSRELFMKSEIGVKITGAPIVLNATAPQQIISGDDVQYVVDYKNIDEEIMNDVQIRINFPQGFKMMYAEPEPSEGGSYWYIGNLDPQQGGKITIDGQIVGDEGQSKTTTISIGHIGSGGEFMVFDERALDTQIVAPILIIKQNIAGNPNNIIRAGDSLNFQVTYRNTGDIGLRDAIVTVEIKGGKILDMTRVISDGGHYDETTGTISWKASDVPGLMNIDPHASGVVSFTVPVKQFIPVEDKADKHFAVSTLAKIDSPDVPYLNGIKKLVGHNNLKMQLAPKVFFRSEVYYADTKIKNSGPLPMQVGGETTFAVHWIIENICNDLSGAKVVTFIPSGVRWTGQIYPTDSKITYNERTGELVWDAGNIPAGAGAKGAGASPPREFIFQVAVTPQGYQMGSFLPLVNKATLTAKDIYVGEDITKQIDNQSTGQVKDGSGQVQKKIQ
jgi:hypothetical protein